MVRKSWHCAVLTILLGFLPGPRGMAQTPVQAPAAPPAAAAQTEEPDPLPGLPRPPDAPRTLMQAAPAAPPYSCAPLPGPYFELDPRLDRPELPQPGWLASVDLAIVGPHVKNHLTDMVQIGNRTPDTVQLPSAALNWTVSPRIELGYRLPSGFGAFAIAYKTLATDGSESIQGADGVAALKSRLDVNIGDLDYLSWEMSLWPDCGMKWWFGLRLANVFFDSQATEDFAAAAAGSGVFAAHTTNHFLGGGPHFGLELTRPWPVTGLSLTARADAATLLGRVRQDFLEISTTPGPGGALLAGETRRSNPQDVPMLDVFLGVTWQPPRYPNLHLCGGYEYEYWWNVGRLSTAASRGEWNSQGILLRAAFNF
jgi:hypothetical protein